MRIISGSAKGKKLAGFSGTSIRPTSDRVREAVFSSLFSQLGTFKQIRVLDLFAGTGAMAIEALSRGAETAVLVDQSRDSQRIIRENLKTTGLTERAAIQSGSAGPVLAQLGKYQESFDLIFIDPPYADDGIADVLQAVNDFGLLKTDGIMCVETAEKVQLPSEIGTLSCTDRRKYGSTAISYYEHKDNGA